MPRSRKRPVKQHVCSICDQPCEVTHLHHIWEKSEGGPNVMWNFLEICPTCHARNHNGTLKIIALRMSSAGLLVHYIDKGQEHFKPVKR